MATVLTEKMKAAIFGAVTISGCDFKYSSAVEIDNKLKLSHRVMIRGEVTKGEWIWVGHSTDGIYEFESAAQARLFIAEMKAEFKSRKQSEV